MNLPVDPDILRKRIKIPSLIAEISYIYEKEAIKYLRIWGEKKMPITLLHQELISLLEKLKNE